MIVRLCAATVLGLVVTAGLLFLMQLMLTLDRRVPVDATRYGAVDFVRVEREPHVERSEPTLERPPEPERPPELPQPPLDRGPTPVVGVSVRAPAIGAMVDPSLGRLAVSDGEYLPIVAVTPVYPTRALAARLEGVVLVEFVVTASGTVRDVVVLESTAAIFERPAVDAASKFKFKPRVVDGKAVEVHGVKNRILFVLEKSEPSRAGGA